MQILSHCDRKTLVLCLRVSLQLQDLAGDSIYRRIELGAEPVHGQTMKGSLLEAVMSGADGMIAPNASAKERVKGE